MKILGRQVFYYTQKMPAETKTRNRFRQARKKTRPNLVVGISENLSFQFLETLLFLSEFGVDFGDFFIGEDEAASENYHAHNQDENRKERHHKAQSHF